MACRPEIFLSAVRTVGLGGAGPFLFFGGVSGTYFMCVCVCVQPSLTSIASVISIVYFPFDLSECHGCLPVNLRYEDVASVLIVSSLKALYPRRALMEYKVASSCEGLGLCSWYSTYWFSNVILIVYSSTSGAPRLFVCLFLSLSLVAFVVRVSASSCFRFDLVRLVFSLFCPQSSLWDSPCCVLCYLLS